MRFAWAASVDPNRHVLILLATISSAPVYLKPVIVTNGAVSFIHDACTSVHVSSVVPNLTKSLSIVKGRHLPCVYSHGVYLYILRREKNRRLFLSCFEEVASPQGIYEMAIFEVSIVYLWRSHRRKHILIFCDSLKHILCPNFHFE